MNKKSVLLIGSGSTYGDSICSSEHRRPPLDTRFFINAKRSHPIDTESIDRYFTKFFNYDIFSPEHDRLEQAMVILYSDIFHPHLGNKTFNIFRKLIKLYNKRIAETTNKIKLNNKCKLFKLIASQVRKVGKISNITFITFNQDIHIEKTLLKFESYSKYQGYGRFLNFPYCYDLDSPIVTSPHQESSALFERGDKSFQHPKIYKLHGSLNWFSTHNSSNISRKQIFNPKRNLHVTKRKDLTTSLVMKKERKKVHTFPIIIPPILHKGGILHNSLKPLWSKSEKALKDASEIIVFGYSCPKTDIGSANMIRRAIIDNENLKNISVIDPNPDVAHRYLKLLEIDSLHYYKNVNSYLKNC